MGSRVLVRERGVITIPIEIRKELKIEGGTVLEIRYDKKKKEIVLKVIA